MNKKAESGLIVLAIVVVAIVAISRYGDKLFPDETKQIENEAGEVIKIIEKVKEDDFHLGEFYEGNFPDYMALKESQCVSAGGDWVIEKDGAGCFNIPSWDEDMGCSSGQVQILKTVCITAKGVFTCDAHNVGCEI